MSLNLKFIYPFILSFNHSYNNLSLGLQSFSSIKYKGDVIEPRRAHLFTRFGRNLLCYGGINHLSKIIGDLWIFDITTQDFKNVVPFINNLGPIAFSAWCGVFYPRIER